MLIVLRSIVNMMGDQYDHLNEQNNIYFEMNKIFI